MTITTQMLKDAGCSILNETCALDVNGEVIAMRHVVAWQLFIEGGHKPRFRVKAISQKESE